jgi:hypothetical protein
MKIGILRTIAHNVADSLGSGCGLLIGVYDMNVYGEAKKSPGQVIAIDFLAAKAIEGKVSRNLASAIKSIERFSQCYALSTAPLLRNSKR